MKRKLAMKSGDNEAKEVIEKKESENINYLVSEDMESANNTK